MIKNAASKVMWVGRATVFLVGLAVVLALVVGFASVALAANGQPFLLGRLTNAATAVTKLTANIAGPALQVNNLSTSPAATGLRLVVDPGNPPLTVIGTAGTATNLDADKVDGLDSSEIGVNGLQRVEASSAESSASPKQVTASCPPGKTLVGTGFDIFGGKSGTDPNTRTDVVMDFVIPGSTSVTVAAYEVNGTTANWHVKAIAICAKAP